MFHSTHRCHFPPLPSLQLCLLFWKKNLKKPVCFLGNCVINVIQSSVSAYEVLREAPAAIKLVMKLLLESSYSTAVGKMLPSGLQTITEYCFLSPKHMQSFYKDGTSWIFLILIFLLDSRNCHCCKRTANSCTILYNFYLFIWLPISWQWQTAIKLIQ